MHLGPVGIEDAANLDGQAALTPVGKEQGFGAAFAFVVARADAVGVHMAPVAFWLRMYFGVAVNFAGGSLVDARAKPFGKAQHVDGAVYAGLDGLHRVVLIMYGRGRAGQIVNFIHLYIEGKSHVVADKLKPAVIHKRFHVGAGAGKKVVHAEHFVPFVEQTFAQM